MPPKKKRISEYTEEQLKNMKRSEIIDGMTDREIAFCEYYIHDYNVKMAALKAGYKPERLSMLSRIAAKPKVVNYVAWLKLRVYEKAKVEAVDLFNGYAKMAFYDISDYVEIENGEVKIKDLAEVDGQIIQEISQNVKGGITVKFPDRIKAYEHLENYMDSNPYDWKRKIEEEKLNIMKERVEIEKTKAGMLDEIEDDGFLDALEKAAQNLNLEEIEVYEDEE